MAQWSDRRFTWLSCLALIACWGSLSFAESPSPNFIVIFIDDMGWGDFSCFGNKDAKTENIDRLAKQGIRFSQFYVNAPICSPSRCALTTGQYPHRWRITSYLNNRADNARRGVANWLDPKAITLPRVLQQHGYATGHFGKWHLGGQRDVDDAPPITEYGFDQSLTNFEGMGPKLLPLTQKPGQDPPGRIWEDAERLGGPFTWMQRSQITTGFVDAAISFIDASQKQGKPFYVNLWPDDVHGPLWPPVDRWAEGKRPLYLAVLESMDRQLGKLFDHVSSSPALRDNTVILICSDNGPEPGAGSAGPFRGSKTTLYEGGVRSPLIVWSPKFIPASKQGSHNDESVLVAMDLVPSILAMAKVESPKDARWDGEDLSATLIGTSHRSRQSPIFWRRPPDRKTVTPKSIERLPDLAVRDGNWKLLCEYDGSDVQLYDLSTDIAESNNQATQHPEVVARLTKALLSWHGSMPADNGPALGANAATSSLQRKPNVVLIVADDMGYADLGTQGAVGFKTPHLDQLAAEGTRFTRFYVSQAVCTASRAALMTGCYPNRIGMQGAYNHTSRDGIADEEWLLPEMFKDIGYATAGFGKWHLGTRIKFHPLRHGFDEWMGIPYSNDNSKYHPSLASEMPPLPLYDGEKVIETDPDQASFTQRFTDRAIDFIERNASRPFFLYLPHVMPHVPIFASKEFMGKSQAGLYGDVMQELDHSVGRLMSTLRRLKIEENTVVIFISDNGPFLSYGEHAGSAKPLREGKLTTFEGGVRVPCLVQWIGHVPAGRVSAEPFMGIDWLPTLTEMVGGKASQRKIDGRSVRSLILGDPNAHSPHHALYFYSGTALQAVMSGRWKLHLPHPYITVAAEPGRAGKPSNWGKLAPTSIAQSGVEGIATRHGYRIEMLEQSLFDLEADPSEQRNVAKEHPDVVAELEKMAQGARQELGDSLVGIQGQGLRPSGIDPP